MDKEETAVLRKRWGRLLAQRRALLGYSQQQLAAAIGVSPASISEHERGNRNSMHATARGSR